MTNPGLVNVARSTRTLMAGGRQVKGFFMSTGQTLGNHPAAFGHVLPSP